MNPGMNEEIIADLCIMREWLQPSFWKDCFEGLGQCFQLYDLSGLLFNVVEHLAATIVEPDI